MARNLVRILLAAVFRCAVVATVPHAWGQPPATPAGGVERATWTSPAVESGDGRERPAYIPAEQATWISPAVENEHPWMPVLRWVRQEQAMIDRNVRDYSATIVSRERIGDRLEEYQSIFVKIRHRPPSVYVYVLTPDGHKGEEAIYVEGRNDGKLLGHATGIAGRMIGTVALDPQGATAMNGHRHPITELGIRPLCQRLVGLGNNDVQFAESEVRFLTGLKLNDRRCSGVEVIHPVPRTSFQFHRLRVFIDEQLKLPIRYEQYDWPRQAGGPPELVEEYNFMNVQINQGYTDADFDPRNPHYGFP